MSKVWAFYFQKVYLITSEYKISNATCTYVNIFLTQNRFLSQMTNYKRETIKF